MCDKVITMKSDIFCLMEFVQYSECFSSRFTKGFYLFETITFLSD